MVMAKRDCGIQGTVVYGNKLESAVGSSGEGCDGELLLPRIVEGKTQKDHQSMRLREARISPHLLTVYGSQKHFVQLGGPVLRPRNPGGSGIRKLFMLCCSGWLGFLDPFSVCHTIQNVSLFQNRKRIMSSLA